MGVRHMLKFHLLLPGAIVGALLLLGVSLRSAVVIGMMAGCMSMVSMMGGGSRGDDTAASEDSSTPRSSGSAR